MVSLGRPAVVMALLLTLSPAMVLGATMRTWIEPNSGHIKLGATIVLHVEVAGQIGIKKPLILNPLVDKFDVGTASGSYRNINGQVKAHWKIPMQPKRTGKLQIPALHYGSLQSKPIALVVSPPPSEYRRSDKGPVLARLEAILERDRSPVEAQLVYAIRLIYRENFELLRSHPPPFPENVLLRKLGARKGRNSDGEQYIEHRYALFPQHSGTIQIEPPSAHVRDSNRNRILILAANTVQATITPRPLDTPIWLPAQSLTLSDQWGIDDPNIEVGESLSRTLVLSAEGLLAAQLPELPALDVAALRHYREPDQLDTSINPHSVVGKREYHSKLIPISAGRLVVPEIRLPWWNVESEQWEEAIVPERILWVSAAPPSQPDQEGALNVVVTNSATASPVEAPSAPPDSSQMPPWQREAPSRGNGRWMFSAALSCALMLLFASLWLRELHQRRRFQWLSLRRHQLRANNEQQRLAQLRDACKQNDALAAQNALRVWGAHHRELGGGSLLGLRQYHPALAAALDHLERHLYAADHLGDSEPWHGSTLWQAVESLRQAQATVSKDNPHPPAWALPELYPQH